MKRSLLRPWRRPTPDPSHPGELERARTQLEEIEDRIEKVIPRLFLERERNHFADRIALAYREERRA